MARTPPWMKPDTGREAMGRGNGRACRGGWGRRAWTDQPRNLGGPAGWWTNALGEDITLEAAPVGSRTGS